MARKEDSCCNGCPDCIGCGRKYEKYYTWTCDICGSESEREMFTDIYGRDICDECLESEE